MKPLTELDLRLLLKNSDQQSLTVPQGTLVTPSALEYLRQLRVELVYDDSAESSEQSPQDMPVKKNKDNRPAPKWDFSDPETRGDTPAGEKPELLFFGPDGGTFDYKPESMTHLKGRQLVHKDHPTIIWRGKLDTFIAYIIEAQIIGLKEDNQQFVADLEEIAEFTRQLLAHEIKGKEVEPFHLLGLSAADLRERSHDPVKFFGHRHMLTTYKMGPLCVALNTLRATSRGVELAATKAFQDGAGQSTRDDIIQALNRLSSLLYILMFKYLPKNFEPEHSGI